MGTYITENGVKHYEPSELDILIECAEIRQRSPRRAACSDCEPVTVPEVQTGGYSRQVALDNVVRKAVL